MADSDPHVGVGTAVVTSGTPGIGSTATAIPRTLLSLPRYAKIMGINPAHFAGGHGSSIYPLTNNNCEDIWPRYSWQQSDHVSHQEIAQNILEAEEEIAKYLGYWPGPKWISNEMHKYVQFYRVEHQAAGGRKFPQAFWDEQRKSLKTRWGRVISGGRRAVTSIGTATIAGGGLAYQDLDSDGFYETARVQVSTSLTDACELNVYFTGKSGAPEWEIRDPRSKSISGGVATFLFDSWLFIDPDNLATAPNLDGFTAVSLDTVSPLVTSVDVYREYTDTSSVASQFFWEPSGCNICQSCSVTLRSGAVITSTAADTSTNDCPVCGLRAQDGCLIVRDVELGTVIPAPAQYDSDTGFYEITSYGVSRDPDQVKIWYKAGALSDDYLNGFTCEPLSDYWAQTIAYLATARLDRNICACGNATNFADSLRVDIAYTGGDSSFLVNFDTLKSPFGTRKGEILAWNRVSKFGDRMFDGAVI